MKEMWTDKDEIDRINRKFESAYDMINKLLAPIKFIIPNMRIENIGLYSGNKMRSMYKRFKNSNIDYTDSLVNEAIEHYIVHQNDNALIDLNLFLIKLHNLIGYSKSKKLLIDFINESEELKEYRELSQKVYEFDIESNVIDAIEYTLENATIIVGYDINGLIDEYNLELEKLGINKKVEYRELKDNQIEIPTEELENMNTIIKEKIKKTEEDNM